MSRITRKVVTRLAANGVEADTHHATIRSEFNQAFGGDKLTTEEVREVRAMLSGNDDEPETEESQATSDELLEQAEKFVKKKAREDSNYKRVARVVETTPKGRPSRVVVECTDPQVNGDGESVCEEEREIAVQDVFQVTRCEPCQNRVTQLYRNRLARERRAELRKLRTKGSSKKTKGRKKKSRKK